jgi:hypothetical protein
MTRNISSILMAAALAALACTSAQVLTAEQDAAALEAERVLVAPLNLALRAPVELQNIDEPVWHELLRYFQNQDRRVVVISPVDAELLWMDAIAELEQSGATHDFPTASAHFARRLLEQVDYELLLLPSLVLRSARLHERHAYWDGVHRRLHVRGAPMSGAITEIGPSGNHVGVCGLTGRVSGASLHVALLNPDGRIVYQGLGGLDLIHEAVLDRRAPREIWQLVLRKAPFADIESVRQGIALAFERELPRTARAW